MGPVQKPTLLEIEAAVRASWGPDTSYASDAYMSRGAGQPSRGQCGTTALVVHDLLGGDLMVADLEHEGLVDGVHYWNVLPDGVEVDLTRDQLTPRERLVDVRRVAVPRNRSSAGEPAFLVLRARVALALGLPSSGCSARQQDDPVPRGPTGTSPTTTPASRRAAETG